MIAGGGGTALGYAPEDFPLAGQDFFPVGQNSYLARQDMGLLTFW